MVSALTDHVSRFEEPPRRREKRFVFHGKQSNSRWGAEPPTAWTLTATGPVTIAGPSGPAGVTNAMVSAGTYQLSEISVGGYIPTDRLGIAARKDPRSHRFR